MRGAAFAALLVGWAALAHAEPTAADRDTARSLLVAGDEKLAAGDAVAALKSYASAHAIMNVPVTGAALANAQAATGQLVEARETCLAVGRMAPAAAEPAPFKKARGDCAALLAKVEPKIPSIKLVITGAPAGAEPTVTIDGVALTAGAWSVPRKVNPGKHTVAAALSGFHTASTEIVVAESATKDVSLALVAKPAGSAGPPPAASTAPTAASASPVAPPPSSSPPARRSTLVYAGFGVAAVGVGVGSVVGMMQLSKASKAKEGCEGNVCPRANQDDIDKAKSLGTISTAAFAVGFIGAGVGVIGLVTGGSKESPSTGVRVSPGPGSLWLDGRF